MGIEASENVIGAVVRKPPYSSEELKVSIVLVFGLFIGGFVGWMLAQNSDAIVLGADEKVFSFVEDVNGKHFDFKEVFCTQAADEKPFCFTGFSIDGFKINFVVPEVIQSG